MDIKTGTEQGRKIVKVVVSPDLLAQGIIQGQITPSVECVKGIPLGAKCLFTSFDEMRGWVCFWYEHESFEEIPWHLEPPIIHILFKAIYPDEAPAPERGEKR